MDFCWILICKSGLFCAVVSGQQVITASDLRCVSVEGANVGWKVRVCVCAVCVCVCASECGVVEHKVRNHW